MSEPLDRAVDARLDAYRPDTVPPFAAIEARKRRRDRRRVAGTGVLSILAVAGAALLVPSLTGGGGRLTPDRDARVYAGPGTPEPSCAYTDMPGTSCASEAGPLPTRTGPLGDNGRASCAESYNIKSIGNRAFAFDGTVVSIGEGGTNKADKGQLDTAAVAFQVNEWFKGGAGETATVDLVAPTSNIVGDETPAYEEGTRLLVSGEPRWGGAPLDDAIAWSCGGFTRYYEPAVADDWRTGTASAEGSSTASVDECRKVDTLLFDATTTGGARSAEEAATRFVESHQKRDSRYATTDDEWRVISGDGSDERQLRRGDVQVGVARGTDGTWHLLGAALCGDA